MKYLLQTVCLLLATQVALAQLNMSLVAHRSYDQDLNDIWGWVDPDDSTEYALVGTTTGLSIVSLADPTNPDEVAFVPGPGSIWRDIKTWGNHVYVTNETGNGLLVVDMSNAPDSITWFEWSPDLPGLGKLESCHNLYIDEYGYCYLAGCNLNDGGMLIIDVASEPGQPQFVAAAPNTYAHDVYVRDNRMYAAEIYLGRLGIYDVSDKENIELLATQTTPFQFTHNAWLNDAGDVVFTTDEKGNAPVTAYDISNLNNIEELDQFVPIATMGEGVIPHNVHVWNDWLIISYYTAGGIIVDASHPDNLIEVGNFDTFFGANAGFNGAWGAYPFLPSGLVLVSDISKGLYVLAPNYVRACRLEGQVTDSQTGAPIQGAEVHIESAQANFATTDLSGLFKTGQALAGTFDVTFSAVGYQSKTVQATLANGELTVLNVQLDPLPSFSLSGAVVSAEDGSPVPGARILLKGQLDVEVTADANGQFALTSVLAGDYQVYAGAWGYQTVEIGDVSIQQNASLTIQLPEGYYDDFMVDLGWESTSTATSGAWELGEPVGTTFQGQMSNPDEDVDFDIGDRCYVTGNGGGGAGNDDVDNGEVVLTSPPMDLSDYVDPVLVYSAWFFNDGGNQPPNDTLFVIVTNGTEEVVLEKIHESAGAWRAPAEWHLKDYIALTNEVRVRFVTSDLQGSGHLVEAAVDAFRVEEQGTTSTRERVAEVQVQAWPNPFGESLHINWQSASSWKQGILSLIDARGRQVWQRHINGPTGSTEMRLDLPAGIYWLKLEAEGQTLQLLPVVRQ